MRTKWRFMCIRSRRSRSLVRPQTRSRVKVCMHGIHETTSKTPSQCVSSLGTYKLHPWRPSVSLLFAAGLLCSLCLKTKASWLHVSAAAHKNTSPVLGVTSAAQTSGEEASSSQEKLTPPRKHQHQLKMSQLVCVITIPVLVSHLNPLHTVAAFLDGRSVQNAATVDEN